MTETDLRHGCQIGIPPLDVDSESCAGYSLPVMADTTLIDPLGRTIILHDHTWWGHIVKFHPDMRGQRQAVESAVRSPLSTHFSASDPDCRLYYGQASPSGVLVAVVADVAGFVKTAYRTDRPKGAVEWSQSTP